MKPPQHFVIITILFVLFISNSRCDGNLRTKRDDFIRTKIISGSGLVSSSRPDEEPFLLRSDSELLLFELNPPYVYVGGVNVLYQLRSNDLGVVHSVRTGPQLDSARCHASGCAANISQEVTNNFNKVLVVDRENNKLLVCGSVYQGSCSKYELQNISEEPEFLPEPVAANDARSTTFAFIGPQRYNRWGHGNVLYVGTTFTSHGDYRHDVPAISSRNLHDLQFAEYSFSKQSLLRIDVKFRDRFLVNYVYGFNTTSYIFFVTVQKRSHLPGDEEKGYITRLARICVSDVNYDTYTEVTLDCGGFGIARDAFFVEKSDSLNAKTSYRGSRNESFLVATFTNGKGPEDDSPNLSSAVCVYSMSQINRLFDENIHNCFNGSMGHRNMEYISGPIQDGKCPGIGAMGNIHSFCDVGLKISGVFPIFSKPIQEFEGADVTSIHFAESGDNGGVLVVGTSAGRLLVILLTPSGDLKLLTDYQLTDVAPITKVILASDNDVLALQKNSLTKIRASNCAAHKTCSSCVSSGDPFCGWCAFRSKCSHSADCHAHKNVSQWFSSTPRQCSHVEAVVPASISLPFTTSSAGHLNLVISSLPTLPSGESFVCVYANSTVVKAKPIQRGLQCPIPKSEVFAEYLSNSEDTNRDTVQLDVRFATLDTPLVSTQVRLLDCSRETTCHDCSRHSECNWCMENNACMAKSERSCYQYVRGPHDGIPSDKCPTLKTTEMSVPNDVPLRIEMQFSHLPSFYNGAHLFWCLVHIEEAKFKVSARMIWENSTVICDETTFKYNAEVAEIQATVGVLVNKAADLLDMRTITVYKCSVLGSYRNSQDCTLCIAHRETYGCTWCGEEGCVSSSRCSSNFTECPGPEIFSIRPRSGPLEGGTVLTIEGSNLGTSVQDLRGRIKIGSRDCSLLSLKNSVEATCLTPQSVPRERNASVTLLTNRGPVQSPVKFGYTDFFITNFSPTKGSISGGTKVRILGRNLDIGANALAYLDEVPCLVDPNSITTDALICTTSYVSEERVTQNLTLIIDGAVRQLRAPFFYTPNPVVHNIRPLTSIYSGGRILSVHGEYFDSIGSAGLLVYNHDGVTALESPCKILSGRLMECVTPPLHLVLGKATVVTEDTEPVELHIGLKMDNATGLLHLSTPHSSRPDLVLHYVRDPLYSNFTNNLKVYKGDELVIEGSRLNVASDQNDVRVMIGNEFCNITSLTSTQLLCVPPAHQPPPEENEDDDLPQVTVLVGSSGLRYRIGHVKYNVADEDLISSEVIGAISAVTAILISVGIVVLIVLKHKSSNTEREYKRIQIQMDLLENNVRSECKQAFAELQTDMTDLTMELEATGIPFVSHRDYVMNVFFPGVRDHPVLIKQDWSNNGGNGSTVFGFSMLQFEQLILNKMFLVTLIDTVERQPNFGIRDRVNFASLLSLVLMTRMDYFSEVLKLLLVRLIEKSLCSRHPQLMLRRTETVVEKLLTNWLALCMYGHLERQAGSSLFLLYKAIKCQIEKGPVDIVTQESKYSLSEEGLLRESWDYSPVTCLVLQRELDEAYHAKVLDCDSITQVKAKVLDAIYKNTPFSLRPAVDEVDLEWQCGQDAHVVLQDFDLTTKEEPGGLKKVNTLRHYGIKNKAVVSLVPKQFNVNTGVINNNLYISDAVTSQQLSHSKQQFHLRPPDSAQLNSRGGGASSSSSGGSSSNTVSHMMMEKAQKTIPEVFLTRLLSTKGTIKKFIDDFFRTILSTDAGEFPSAVKWLFDIFDESLRAGYIDDPSVVHAWKSNSLPLRFWINMIKNPDFVFDVEKTGAVELNLSIVAQTLMSSCLPNDPVLNKESPSHKLLFAREINEYRIWISDFYEHVQKMPQVTDQDLNCYMHRLSQLHEGEFNRTAALKELFLYVSQYYQDLAVAFSGGVVQSPSHVGTSSSGLSSPRLYMSPVPPGSHPQQDLSIKLEHIFNIVKESDHLYACAS